MSVVREISEEVARKTSRRGLFGRGAGLLFGALAGAAVGTVTRGGAGATHVEDTLCSFPGDPCPCEGCLATGLCAKPCTIVTAYYASGCWVQFPRDGAPTVTCCDCACSDVPGNGWCGCGSDYHNDPHNCPP